MSSERPPELSGPAPVRTRGARRRTGAVVLVAALAVLGLVGGAWWWAAPPPDAPRLPPLPTEISDPEVKRAVETARAKVLATPHSAEDWGHYALVLFAHLFGPEADECFALAGERNPADARWRYGRALLALKQNDPNAVEYFRQTIAIGDSRYSPLARFGLADHLLAQGQIEPAAELYRQELAPGPGYPRAALGLGQIALATGDDATATRLLTSVRDDPHARKRATALLAQLARRGGDESAARAFEAESNEANTRPWPDPLVSQMVGLMVGVQGRKQRIDTHERQGQYAAAHEEYLRLLALERAPKTLARAATNLAQLGNFDGAVALAREAAERDPDDANVQYAFALVRYTGLEKELARDPGSAAVGDACREIVTAARRAVERKPDHARAHLLWGLALKRLGELGAARDRIQHGVSIRSDDVELLVGLGQVLAAIGDTRAAIAAFEEAKKAKPNDPRADRELKRLHGP